MNKKVVGYVTSIVVIFSVVGLVWINHYDIYDWAKLRNYHPPAQIAELATQSGMNNYGRTLFYVNDPKILDKATFQAECSQAEQTIVLGCYNGRNIYIYKVDDPTLNGVEQVTAAHEMLHAAYQRLSPVEKKHVDELLQAAYYRLNDPELIKTFESYHKSEPGEEWNEMHSVMGTEYSNLGPELDTYYSKYFSDRSKVFTYSKKYKQIFDDLKNQVEQYDAQLSLLKADIDQKQSELDTQLSNLEIQKTQLNSLLSSNKNAVYNSQVSIYNATVYSYNINANNLKSLIGQYNSLVEQRNKITVQQQTLAKNIDSRATQQIDPKN